MFKVLTINCSDQIMESIKRELQEKYLHSDYVLLVMIELTQWKVNRALMVFHLDLLLSRETGDQCLDFTECILSKEL